jgi:hypothetical protein
MVELASPWGWELMAFLALLLAITVLALDSRSVTLMAHTDLGGMAIGRAAGECFWIWLLLVKSLLKLIALCSTQ